MYQEQYSSYVRSIPNFPKEGILFRDISPLLADAKVYKQALLDLASNFPDYDVICGIESRGFLMSSPLSVLQEKPQILMRKAGKLPPPVVQESYSLEYGEATLEVSVQEGKGKRCVLVDDVLATGGTLCAAVSLLKKVGFDVVAIATLIDLKALHGDLFGSIPYYTLLEY